MKKNNKLERIQNSAVYDKEPEAGHQTSIYYMIFEKSHFEDNNRWKPALAV